MIFIKLLCWVGGPEEDPGVRSHRILVPYYRNCVVGYIYQRPGFHLEKSLSHLFTVLISHWCASRMNWGSPATFKIP